jgi:hypothetical protein
MAQKKPTGAAAKSRAEARSANGPSSRTDFRRLRAAFETLSDVYACGGRISKGHGRLALSDIPRARWSDLSKRVNADQDLIADLIEGPGQRAAVEGRREISVAAIGADGVCGRVIEIGCLETLGRGAISKSFTIRTDDRDWKARLRAAFDWSVVDGIVACAEGNNQRAAIGLVLQLAGIGRGKLEMIEAEVPAEIDETTHMVRGADWMKAGLPRFRSASAEALWCLMRIRSVHSRLARPRRQGLYTAMACAALQAAGAPKIEIARRLQMPAGLVSTLLGDTEKGRKSERTSLSSEMHLRAMSVDLCPDDADPVSEAVRAASAFRVWKGAEIHARSLAWRISASHRARGRLADGDGLVDVAGEIGASLRDMVRLLSISEAESKDERRRFLQAVLDGESIASASLPDDETT